VIAALSENEIFGELAFINHSLRTETVAATELTEVVALSRIEFWRLLETVDLAVKRVIKVLCK